MIKCNIEVNEYTTNQYNGEKEFSFSTVQYVLNFPVLPSIGSVLTITNTYDTQYEILDIEYRANLSSSADVEIYIIVEEV